jgi:carbon monoxide dehydrogenase subunit G
MNLENQFRVDVPVETAWAVLLDLERIAPCMPGAQLQEVEGDEYRGIVKVKVGPITAQYKGAAQFTEVDEAAHRAVIKANGRDTRGQGNASATVTAQLTPNDGGTLVQLTTDLTVTGKVAQFGRGVMADVSSKLLGQFVECLESDVLAGSAPTPSEPSDEPAPAPAAAPPGAVRTIDAPDAEPVDLMKAAGSAVAKRLVPVLIAVAVIVVVIIILVAR